MVKDGSKEEEKEGYEPLPNLKDINDKLIKIMDYIGKLGIQLDRIEKRLNYKPAVEVRAENDTPKEVIYKLEGPKPRAAMDGSVVQGTFEISKHKDKGWTFETITVTPAEFTDKAFKSQEYPNWVALSMMKGSVKKLQVAQSISVPNFYTKLLNKEE
jgi:hypothetical protein